MPDPITEPITTPEEAPLAFAAPPAADPVMADPVQPTLPPPPPTPVTPPMTPPPVVPPSPSPEMPVKKKGLAQVVATVVGILLLIGAVGTGALYYYNSSLVQESAQIAAISDLEKSECSGCSPAGYKLKWLTLKGCVVTETRCTGGLDAPEDPGAEKAPATKALCDANPNYGSWCAGCVNKCVSWGELGGIGCNAYVSNKCGTPIIYGANGTPKVGTAACNVNGVNKECQCGTRSYCFDKTGICNQAEADKANADQPGSYLGTNYDQMGLCSAVGNYDPATGGFTPRTSTNDNRYTCTDNGCSVLDSSWPTCYTIRYTCSDTVAGNSCTTSSSAFISATQPAQSTSFEGKCGTVEQLDVSCGQSGYVTSRTRKNAECFSTPRSSGTPRPSTPSSPTPTPSGAPSMSCTGITRAPTTAPVVGSALTFTCAGQVRPTSAGTLNYKFRYRVNSGAYTTLANATATTAQLTIEACGSYEVQCQACTTLNGVLTCDPIWTGATQ